jgi:hypothetical protein
MNLFKKVYGLLLGIVACVIIYLMAGTELFFGKFVNRFFPCTENPASSFPCYGIYDIAIMALAFVVGLLLAVVVISRVIKSFKVKA